MEMNREALVPRVLLVIGQLGLGGAEVQVVRLAKRLRQLGVDPEVAIYHPGYETELIKAGIRVHHVKRSSKVGLEAIVDLSRILKEGGFHIVHSYLWPANWRARIAGVLARTPVIVSSTRSVETWLKPHHVWMDRILALRTDAIVVNAAAIRDYLIEKERLSETRFCLIYNGLDEEIFSRVPLKSAARAQLSVEPETPLVVTVGNLQPEKNHEHFVRMAALVLQQRPDAEFIVVGEGPRRAILESMVRDLGLGGRIVFAGLRADVLPYLAACDVFVNVSWREGCCNAILEAMAAARPVVAYAVGGNPEVIRNHETGKVVPFGEVKLLADEVVRYLNSPEAAEAHGRQGAERVRNTFLAHSMAEQTARLYRELLVLKGVVKEDKAGV